MSDDGLRFNDRVLVLGDTGSGKSELLNYLWEGFACQRLLLDSKDEFSVRDRAGELVEPVGDVDELDWRQPVIHYVPTHDSGDRALEEMGELFGAAYRTPAPLIVFAHELSDVCNYSAARTPPAFDSYVSKGRARRKGLFAGSQLPVHMPVRARTLNQHVMVCVPRFIREDDMRAVAQAVGRETRELAAQLDAVHAELGEHAYVWFNRRTRELVACPPLSDEQRRRITIERRVDG